ncbi:MAG: phosphopyruvate hydratase [Bacilli bacterium]|nr:phosphopyruvate hydratase [Bacilli bacterium]
MKIKDVIAREILDSRGNPTVEVDTILENGVIGRYSVPSGASTGSKEALELRDNDKRYHKKGVKKVVDMINNELKYEVIKENVLNQKKIDNKLIKKDGTKNKSKYGANGILAVSMSVLTAGANYNKIPIYEYIGNGKILPRIMVNIINGGMHANNNLDFQEFMIIPINKSIKEQIRMSSEVFNTLKELLKMKGYNTNVGDEGGFAPNLNSNIEALDLIMEAIKKSGYTKDFYLGLDIAANSFYDGSKYIIEGKSYTTLELVEYYKDLTEKYPIISIEDPFYESDYKGFKELTKKIGKNVQIVGDDLFVTNKDNLKKGIKGKYANTILIKPNQIGTYTEMLETIKLAKQNNIKTIISHRSGETENTIITHLAVGLNLGQIKCGSMSRTDRICKYNELIRIEEKIGDM